MMSGMIYVLIDQVYVFKSRFLKSALWGRKLSSDLKLLRGTLDSWSVGCSWHRAHPEEAGHPILSFI